MFPGQAAGGSSPLSARLQCSTQLVFKACIDQYTACVSRCGCVVVCLVLSGISLQKHLFRHALRTSRVL